MTDPQRTAQFLLAYRRHRVAEQATWHQRRGRQYLAARRWTLWLSSGLLATSALCGGLGTLDAARRPMWAFLATGLAAVASAITGYEAAFGFQRLSRQYADTAGALHMMDVRAPTDDEVAGANGTDAVRHYVAETERALLSEVTSWAKVVGERGGSIS